MAPRTSSFCSGGDCVEVERLADVIVLTTTRGRGRYVLCTLDEWQAFIEGVKDGEFDPAQLLR
jgi:hypothetical protein